MKRLLLPLLIFGFNSSLHALPVATLGTTPQAESTVTDARMLQSPQDVEDEAVNEFDPYDPNARQYLQEFDAEYQKNTGIDTFSDSLFGMFDGLIEKIGGCRGIGCHVFANVVKGNQTLYLYIDGALVKTWPVSTAKAPRVTPNFSGHPSGPFYAGKYSSKKFPGGDYHGLGNMPYAIFYHGNFAIHGTPAIGALGRPASHGCVRSHPDNAAYFSSLVRSTGAGGVWVTVSQTPVKTAGLR